MSNTGDTTTTAAPGTVAATDATGAATTATTPAASTSSADSTTLFGFPLGNWVERGFLVIIGLVIVAFGLWHLFTAPSPQRSPPP